MARPASMPADGMIRVAFAATLTASAPAATALTAGTDLTYYLTADGFSPSVDQATVTDDRLGDAQTFEVPGRYSFKLDKIRYTYNTVSGDDAARIALVAGTTGFIAVRWGIAAGTAWTAAQKVDVWPVTLGQPVKLPPTANSVLHIEQAVFVTNTVVTDVAVV